MSTPGAQAGAMLTLVPLMLGGAAVPGRGLQPDHLPRRERRGGRQRRRAAQLARRLRPGAILVNALNLKIAGGVGVWHLDKNRDDGGAISGSGAPANPQLIKQNLGETMASTSRPDPSDSRWNTSAPAHLVRPRVPSRKDPTMAIGIDHAGTDRELHQRRPDRGSGSSGSRQPTEASMISSAASRFVAAAALLGATWVPDARAATCRWTRPQRGAPGSTGGAPSMDWVVPRRPGGNAQSGGGAGEQTGGQPGTGGVTVAGSGGSAGSDSGGGPGGARASGGAPGSGGGENRYPAGPP